MHWRSGCYFAIIVHLVSLAAAGETLPGLRCPDGFEISQYADESVLPDAVRLALDPKGRIVVSGPGYIRVLVDGDKDGRAERALEFSSEPRHGAMGMLWEGDSLYYIGQGGLRRLRDADGDGRADGPSELLRAVRASGEHDAHALRRGPDGWLYLLCGNSAGIDASWAQLPTSPIKAPVAGCVVRFTPDLKESEIVADGFRNAYGMDFNDDGELFTYDSDNERCVSLPWYEPTRFYHVVAGGHHGWLSPQRAGFWRLPSYAADVVTPVITLGRGSPTGVACYRGTQFPAAYRGGFFVLDWTFGRVEFLALTRSGSSYAARRERFLETVGENGFAPTDVLVHPTTGELFISIGGRGTRGAIYRVRYVGASETAAAEGRVSAVELPTWADLSWRPGCEQQCLSDATGDDWFVRRRALAYLRRHRQHFGADMVAKAVTANWSSDDRLLRASAADLLADLDVEQRSAQRHAASGPRELATWAMAAAEPPSAVRYAITVIADGEAPADARLAAVRAVQRALGDLVAPSLFNTVWEGYSPRTQAAEIDAAARSEALAALRAAFPAGHAEFDRELSRTLAMLEDDDPELPLRVAEQWTKTSDPLDDIHYLIVLARLRGRRGAKATSLTARALVCLDAKLDRQHARRDLFFPLRLGEMYAELARQDSELNRAVIDDGEFGRPEHALFAEAPGFDRQRAAELILANLTHKSDDEGDVSAWNAALVALVGELPEKQSLPVLRRLWGEAGLDDAILLVLSRHPHNVDRPKFVAGIGSPQPSLVSLSIEALEKLPRPDDEDLLALIRALARFPSAPEHEDVRRHIVAALQRISGETIQPRAQAWEEWLTRSHPDLAARLGGADGVDLPRWRRRLAEIDWSEGDAARGRKVFVQASCAACHSAGQALGPDLSGVAGRFSRDDLFTAILQPSRDVSSRYRTVSIVTVDGKVYQGMLIYDAVDGVILQTGASTAVRLAGDQISIRRPASLSLMPAGLLDKLGNAEISDLYAYLKSLARAAALSKAK